jgi:hypothetical protein
MRTILAAVLATVIIAPCMAASDNQSEDKTSGDVQAPGVTEPRTPDTLKSAPDQRIQSEGRASEEEKTVGEKNRGINENRNLNENRNDDKR